MSAIHFKDLRDQTKETPLGLAGMDSMVFVGGYQRSRGIKPWEVARYEADVKRQKAAEFFKARDQEQRRKLQNMGNFTQQETAAAIAANKEKKEKEEQRLVDQRKWDAEHPFAGYVDTGVVDAWD